MNLNLLNDDEKKHKIAKFYIVYGFHESWIKLFNR